MGTSERCPCSEGSSFLVGTKPGKEFYYCSICKAPWPTQPEQTDSLLADRETTHGDETILEEVQRVINGPRREDYGTVKANFECHRNLMNAWRRARGKPADVDTEESVMSHEFMKVSRAATGRVTRDTCTDGAGYWQIMAVICGFDPEPADRGAATTEEKT